MRLVTAEPGRARGSRTGSGRLLGRLLAVAWIAHALKVFRFVPIGHRDDVVSDRRRTNTADRARRLGLQHRLPTLRPVSRQPRLARTRVPVVGHPTPHFVTHFVTNTPGEGSP